MAASIERFLWDAKIKYQQNLKDFLQVHVVIGNEACDLDSAVSAITYSYYLYTKNRDLSTLYLPVLNIQTVQYRLRTETTYFFKRFSISADSLIFRDQINFNALKQNGKLVLRLVDHNVLPGKDAALEDCVISVIDHRQQERKQSEKVTLKLDLVGSCCTLVAEELLNDQDFVIDRNVAELLYGTILVDTLNRSPDAGKLMPRDEKVLERLEAIIPDINGDSLYEELQQAKLDIRCLLNMEILEKDLKLVTGNDMTIAMSSVTMDMKELLARPDFRDDLEQFCKHQGAEVVVIMTLSSDTNGKPFRDIAVYSQNRIFRDQISDSLDNSADVDLSLDLVCSPLDSITVYHQKNVKASRKQVLPILQSFLCGDITPDVTSKEFVTQQSIAMAMEGFSHIRIVNPVVEGNVNKESVQNLNINFDLYSPDLINVAIDNNSHYSDGAAETVKSSNVDAPFIDQCTNVNSEDNSLAYGGQTDAAFDIITDIGEISDTTIHDNKMPGEQYDNMLEFDYFAQNKCVSAELYSHVTVPNNFEEFPNAQNGSSTGLCTANSSNVINFDTLDKTELIDTFSAVNPSWNLVTSESTQQKDEKYNMMHENTGIEDDELIVMYVNDTSIQDQTELTPQNISISEPVILNPLVSDKTFDENFHDLDISKSTNPLHKEDTTLIPVHEMEVSANVFIDKGLPAVSTDFLLESTNILLDNSFNTSYSLTDQVSLPSSTDSLSLIVEVDAQSQSDNMAELTESDLYDAITTSEIQTLQDDSPFTTSGMNSPFVNSGIVSPRETMLAASSRRVSEYGHFCVPPNSLKDYTLDRSERDSSLPTLNNEKIVEREYKNTASLDRGIDCQGQEDEDGFNVPHSAQNRVRDDTNHLRKDISLLSLEDDDIVGKVQEKRNCLVRDFISFEIDESASLRNTKIDTNDETSNPCLGYEHKTDIFSNTEASKNSANVFKDTDDFPSDTFFATDKTDVFTEFEIPDQELNKTNSKSINIFDNKNKNTDFTNPFNDFDTIFTSKNNVADNIQEDIDFKNPFKDYQYNSFDQIHVSPVSFDSTQFTNPFEDINILSSNSNDDVMDNTKKGTQQFDSKNVWFNKIDAFENQGLSRSANSAKCIQNITLGRVDVADKIEENEYFTNPFDVQRNKSSGSIDLSGNKDQGTNFSNAFAGFECIPPVKNTNPFKNCDSVSTVTSDLDNVKESIDFTCLFKDLDNMSSARVDSVDHLVEKTDFTYPFTDMEKSIPWVATEGNMVKNIAVTNPFINVMSMPSLHTDAEENLTSSAVSLNPFENQDMMEPEIENAAAYREQCVVNVFSNNPFFQIDDKSLIQPINTSDPTINTLPDSTDYGKDMEYICSENKPVLDQFTVKVAGSDNILDYSDSIPERDYQIGLQHLINFSGADPNLEIKSQDQSVEQACLNVLPDDVEETATNQSSCLDFKAIFLKGVTENIWDANDEKEQCENQSEQKAIAEHEITAEFEDTDPITTVSKKIDLVADLEICAELEVVKSMSKALTKEIIENAVECFPDLTKPVIAKTFTKEILNKDVNMTLEDPKKFDNFSQGSEDSLNIPLFNVTQEVDKNKVFKQDFYIETDYLPNMDPLHGSLNIITSSSSNTQTIETDADKEVVEGESFRKYSDAEDSVRASDTQSMLHLLHKDSIHQMIREMIILKNIETSTNTLDGVDDEVTIEDNDNAPKIRDVHTARFMKENQLGIVGTSLSIEKDINKYMVSVSNLDEDEEDTVDDIKSHRVYERAIELKADENVTPNGCVLVQNPDMDNTGRFLNSEEFKNCNIECVDNIADFNNSCCERVEIFTTIEALPQISADRWLGKSGLQYNVESSTRSDGRHDTNECVSNVIDAQYDQHSFTPSRDVDSDTPVNTLTRDSFSKLVTAIDEHVNAYYEVNPYVDNILEPSSDSWLENTEKQYNVDSFTSSGNNSITFSTSESEQDLITVTENVNNIDSSVLALEYHLRPMEPEPNLNEQECSLKESKDDGFVEERLNNTNESAYNVTDTQLGLHILRTMTVDSGVTVDTVKMDSIFPVDTSMNEDVNVFKDVNLDIDHNLDLLAESWFENTSTYIKYNVDSSTSTDSSSTTSFTSESEQDLVTVQESTVDTETDLSLKYHMSVRKQEPILEEHKFINQEIKEDVSVIGTHNTAECVSNDINIQNNLCTLTPSVTLDSVTITSTVKADSISQDGNGYLSLLKDENHNLDNILDPLEESWLENTSKYIKYNVDSSTSTDSSSTTSFTSESEQDLVTVQENTVDTETDLSLKYHMSVRKQEPILEEHEFINQEIKEDVSVIGTHNTAECVSNDINIQDNLCTLTPSVTLDSVTITSTVKADSISQDGNGYLSLLKDENHNLDNILDPLEESWLENTSKYIKDNVDSSKSSDSNTITSSISERELHLMTITKNTVDTETALPLGYIMPAMVPEANLEEQEFSSKENKDNVFVEGRHDTNDCVFNMRDAQYDMHSLSPHSVDSDTAECALTVDSISKAETAMDEHADVYFEVNPDVDNIPEPPSVSKVTDTQLDLHLTMPIIKDSSGTVNAVKMDHIAPVYAFVNEDVNVLEDVNLDIDYKYEPFQYSWLENTYLKYNVKSSTDSSNTTSCTSESEQDLLTLKEDTGDIDTTLSLKYHMSVMEHEPILEEHEFISQDNNEDVVFEGTHNTAECVSNVIDVQDDLYSLTSSVTVESGTMTSIVKTDNISHDHTSVNGYLSLFKDVNPESGILIEPAADSRLENICKQYNTDSSSSSDRNSIRSSNLGEQDLIKYSQKTDDIETALSLGYIMPIMDQEANLDKQEFSSKENKDNVFVEGRHDTNECVFNTRDAQYDLHSLSPHSVDSDTAECALTVDSISKAETAMDEHADVYFEVNPDVDNILEQPSDTWLEKIGKQYNVDNCTSSSSNSVAFSTSESEQDVIKGAKNGGEIDNNVLSSDYYFRPMKPEPNSEEQESSLKESKDDGFIEESLNKDESVTKMTDTQLDLHLALRMIKDSGATVNAVKIDNISSVDISVDKDVNVFGDVNPAIDYKHVTLTDSELENTFIKYNVKSSTGSDSNSTTSSTSESEQDLITVTEYTGDNDTVSSMKYHMSRMEPEPNLEEYDVSNQESIGDGFVDNRHNRNEYISDITDAQYNLHAVTHSLTVDPNIAICSKTIESSVQVEKAFAFDEVSPDVDNILEPSSYSWLEGRLDTDESVSKVTETQFDMHISTPMTTDSGVTADTVKIDNSSPFDTSMNDSRDNTNEYISDIINAQYNLHAVTHSLTVDPDKAACSETIESNVQVEKAFAFDEVSPDVDNILEPSSCSWLERRLDTDESVSKVTETQFDMHISTPMTTDSGVTADTVKIDSSSSFDTSMNEDVNVFADVNPDIDYNYEQLANSWPENTKMKYNGESSTSSDARSTTSSSAENEQDLISVRENSCNIDTALSLGYAMHAIDPEPNLEEKEFSNRGNKDNSYGDAIHDTNEHFSNVIDAQNDLYSFTHSLEVKPDTTVCSVTLDNISQVERVMDEHANAYYEVIPDVDNILEPSSCSWLEGRLDTDESVSKVTEAQFDLHISTPMTTDSGVTTDTVKIDSSSSFDTSMNDSRDNTNEYISDIINAQYNLHAVTHSLTVDPDKAACSETIESSVQVEKAFAFDEVSPDVDNILEPSSYSWLEGRLDTDESVSKVTETQFDMHISTPMTTDSGVTADTVKIDNSSPFDTSMNDSRDNTNEYISDIINAQYNLHAVTHSLTVDPDKAACSETIESNVQVEKAFAFDEVSPDVDNILEPSSYSWLERRLDTDESVSKVTETQFDRHISTPMTTDSGVTADTVKIDSSSSFDTSMNEDVNVFADVNPDIDYNYEQLANSWPENTKMKYNGESSTSSDARSTTSSSAENEQDLISVRENSCNIDTALSLGYAMHAIDPEPNLEEKEFSNRGNKDNSYGDAIHDTNEHFSNVIDAQNDLYSFTHSLEVKPDTTVCSVTLDNISQVERVMDEHANAYYEVIPDVDNILEPSSCSWLEGRLDTDESVSKVTEAQFDLHISTPMTTDSGVTTDTVKIDNSSSFDTSMNDSRENTNEYISDIINAQYNLHAVTHSLTVDPDKAACSETIESNVQVEKAFAFDEVSPDVDNILEPSSYSWLEGRLDTDESVSKVTETQFDMHISTPMTTDSGVTADTVKIDNSSPFDTSMNDSRDNTNEYISDIINAQYNLHAVTHSLTVDPDKAACSETIESNVQVEKAFAFDEVSPDVDNILEPSSYSWLERRLDTDESVSKVTGTQFDMHISTPMTTDSGVTADTVKIDSSSSFDTSMNEDVNVFADVNPDIDYNYEQLANSWPENTKMKYNGESSTSSDARSTTSSSAENEQDLISVRENSCNIDTALSLGYAMHAIDPEPNLEEKEFSNRGNKDNSYGDAIHDTNEHFSNVIDAQNDLYSFTHSLEVKPDTTVCSVTLDNISQVETVMDEHANAYYEVIPDVDNILEPSSCSWLEGRLDTDESVSKVTEAQFDLHISTPITTDSGVTTDTVKIDSSSSFDTSMNDSRDNTNEYISDIINAQYNLHAVTHSLTVDPDKAACSETIESNVQVEKAFAFDEVSPDVDNILEPSSYSWLEGRLDTDESVSKVTETQFDMHISTPLTTDSGVTADTVKIDNSSPFDTSMNDSRDNTNEYISDIINAQYNLHAVTHSLTVDPDKAACSETIESNVQVEKAFAFDEVSPDVDNILEPSSYSWLERRLDTDESVSKVTGTQFDMHISTPMTTDSGVTADTVKIDSSSSFDTSMNEDVNVFADVNPDIDYNYEQLANSWPENTKMKYNGESSTSSDARSTTSSSAENEQDLISVRENSCNIDTALSLGYAMHAIDPEPNLEEKEFSNRGNKDNSYGDAIHDTNEHFSNVIDAQNDLYSFTHSLEVKPDTTVCSVTLDNISQVERVMDEHANAYYEVIPDVDNILEPSSCSWLEGRLDTDESVSKVTEAQFDLHISTPMTTDSGVTTDTVKIDSSSSFDTSMNDSRDNTNEYISDIINAQYNLHAVTHSLTVDPDKAACSETIESSVQVEKAFAFDEVSPDVDNILEPSSYSWLEGRLDTDESVSKVTETQFDMHISTPMISDSGVTADTVRIDNSSPFDTSMNDSRDNTNEYISDIINAQYNLHAVTHSLTVDPDKAACSETIESNVQVEKAFAFDEVSPDVDNILEPSSYSWLERRLDTDESVSKVTGTQFDMHISTPMTTDSGVTADTVKIDSSSSFDTSMNEDVNVFADVNPDIDYNYEQLANSWPENTKMKYNGESSTSSDARSTTSSSAENEQDLISVRENSCNIDTALSLGYAMHAIDPEPYLEEKEFSNRGNKDNSYGDAIHDTNEHFSNVIDAQNDLYSFTHSLEVKPDTTVCSVTLDNISQVERVMDEHANAYYEVIPDVDNILEPSSCSWLEGRLDTDESVSKVTETQFDLHISTPMTTDSGVTADTVKIDNSSPFDTSMNDSRDNTNEYISDIINAQYNLHAVTHSLTVDPDKAACSETIESNVQVEKAFAFDEVSPDVDNILEPSSYSWLERRLDTDESVSKVTGTQFDMHISTPMTTDSGVTADTVKIDSSSSFDTSMNEDVNVFADVNPDIDYNYEQLANSWPENTKMKYNGESSTSSDARSTTSSSAENEQDLISVRENSCNIDTALSLGYAMHAIDPEPYLEEKEFSNRGNKDNSYGDAIHDTNEHFSNVIDAQNDLYSFTHSLEVKPDTTVCSVTLDNISQVETVMDEHANAYYEVIPDVDNILEPSSCSWLEGRLDTDESVSKVTETQFDLHISTPMTTDSGVTADTVKIDSSSSFDTSMNDSRDNTNEYISDIINAQYNLHAVTHSLTVDPDKAACSETIESSVQVEKTFAFDEVSPDVDNILEPSSCSWLEERLDTDESVSKVTEAQFDLHISTPMTTDSGVTTDTVKIDSSSSFDTSMNEDVNVFADVNPDIDYNYEQLANSWPENTKMKYNGESSTSSDARSTTSSSAENEQDLISVRENSCNIDTALSLGYAMHAIDPEPNLEEKEFSNRGNKDNSYGDTIYDTNEHFSNVIDAQNDLYSFTHSLEVKPDTTVCSVTLDNISQVETVMDEHANAYYEVIPDVDNILEPSSDGWHENTGKLYNDASITDFDSNSITSSTSESEQDLIAETENAGHIETVLSLGSVMLGIEPKPNLEEDEFRDTDPMHDGFVEVRHNSNECVSSIIDMQDDLCTLSPSVAINAIGSDMTSGTLTVDNISQVETAMDEHADVIYEGYSEINSILEPSVDHSWLGNSGLQYSVDSSSRTDSSTTTSSTSESEQDLISVKENTGDIETAMSLKYNKSATRPEPNLEEHEFYNQENQEDVFVDGRYNTNVSNVIHAVCDLDTFTPSIVIDSDTAMVGHASAFNEANYENVDDFSISGISFTTFKEDLSGNVSDFNEVNAEFMEHRENIAANEILSHVDIPENENRDARCYQVAMNNISIINTNMETIGIKSYKSVKDDIHILVDEQDLANNVGGLNEVCTNSADSNDETSQSALVVNGSLTEICENKDNLTDMYSLNTDHTEMNDEVNNLNDGVEVLRITPEIIVENADIDEPADKDTVSCCEFPDTNDVDEINANIQYTVLQNIQIGNFVSPYESPNEEVFDLGFEINPIIYDVEEDRVDSESENSNSSVIMGFAKDENKVAISEQFCKIADNIVLCAMNGAFGSLKDGVSNLHDDSNELDVIADSLVNSSIADAVEIFQKLNSVTNVEQNKSDILDKAKEIHSDYSSDSDISSTTTEGSYRIEQSVEDFPLIASPVQYSITDKLTRLSSLNHDLISDNTTKLSLCKYDNSSDKHHHVDLTGIIMKDLSTDNIKPVSIDIHEDFVIHKPTSSEGHEDVIHSKDFGSGEIPLDINDMSLVESEIGRTDVCGNATISEWYFVKSSNDESRCFETPDALLNSITSFEEKANAELEITGIQCIECDAKVPLKADVKETNMAALNLCEIKDEVSIEQSLTTGKISDISSADNQEMCDYQQMDLKLKSTIDDVAFDVNINDTVMIDTDVITSPNDDVNKDDNKQQNEILNPTEETVMHLHDAYFTRREIFHTTAGLMSISIDSVMDALSSGCDQVSFHQGHDIIHEEPELLDEDQDIPPKETVINVEPVIVKSNCSYEKMKEMDDTQEWLEDPIPGMGVIQNDGSSDSDSSSESDSEYVKPARPNSLFNEANPKNRIAPHSSTLDSVDDQVEGTNDIPTPDDVEGELEWEDETPITPLSENKKFVNYHDERERYENTQFRTVTIAGSDYKVDMHVIEPYKKVVSHGGYYGNGLNAIILFCGCYLPDRERTDYQYVMDNLFLYVISTLELLVAEDYMIVYFHGATPQRQMPSLSWLKRCYQMIDRRLKKNLKALLMVHPTLWLKTVVLMTKPFISSKFTSKLRFVKTLKELETIVPMEYIYVPDLIQQYDAKMTEHHPSTSSPDTSSLHS